MSKIPSRRKWALVEKICPKAAKLLREADDLKSMTTDFAGIFDVDASSPRDHRYLAVDQE